MVWSLVPLIIICAIIAVVSGNCSVGLSGTAKDDKTPAYDVSAALHADATSMSFPIRLPATPAGWKPNSGSSDAMDDGRVSNSGYLTADGIYIQLSQTSASEESLVTYLGGTGVIGDGVTQAGGTQWVRYSADDNKSIWISNLGDVRIGLYGKASESDFRTLAQAALAAKPLPARA